MQAFKFLYTEDTVLAQSISTPTFPRA